MNETLTVTGGAAGLQALSARAAGLDGSALARIRRLGEPADGLEVYVTTPFDVVASRRALGEVSRDGAVVGAARLTDALAQGTTDVGPALDPSWPGALPPERGFELLDTVPVTVVRELADKGQALARQFSGPLGPPKSLLNQTVLTVGGPTGSTSADSADSADTADSVQVEIPMRMIFTCTSLGLIPGFSASMDTPRHLRVSHLGRWIRVDAPFGTVYHSTRLSLF